MKVLSFGEVLWDVYPQEKFIGGAPFNFAAHLAMHGEEVFMLSAVGADDLGNETIEEINRLGVSTKYISRVGGKPTGRCDVELDENAVPSYVLLQDVAYDFIDCSNVEENFDVLYFGTLALRNEHNLNSLCSFMEVHSFEEIFCDVNIRPPYYNKESLQLCFSSSTIIKVSGEELNVVADHLGINYGGDCMLFAKLVAEKYKNIKLVVITLGEEGAYSFSAGDGGEYRCCAQSVKVESTVGAGDSFSAAFLHKYMRGNCLDDCLEYASKVAGYVVAHKGAIPQYNPEEF